MRYRRSNAAGGTFFFTVNLADRSKTLLTDHIDLLRNAVRKVKTSYPFNIDAMVVLPEHLHAIWTLPIDDCNFPIRWRLIKGDFTKQFRQLKYACEEHPVWQHRYWEHQIRDERDLCNHVDYIHINPVKHGYVDTPVDWEYSSIHKFVRDGVLPVDWAVKLDKSTTGFGE